jgi:hypothetical protein
VSRLDDTAPEVGPEAVSATVHEAERLRRWRMLLGSGDQQHPDGTGVQLDGDDRQIDAALSALYDAPTPGGRPGGRSNRAGGLASSAPAVARWRWRGLQGRLG